MCLGPLVARQELFNVGLDVLKERSRSLSVVCTRGRQAYVVELADETSLVEITVKIWVNPSGLSFARI